MHQIFTPQNLSRLGIFLILAGLLFSRFSLSIGMLLLLLATLAGHPLRETWAKFIRQRDLVALTSLFLLYLLTGLYSADQAYFWERIRIALPLLFLPFAFAQPPVRSRAERERWLYFFFLLIVATAIHSALLTVYRQHFAGVSMHLTTPIHHVRYSLMVAFSVFIGLHLFFQHRFRFPFERKMVLCCSALLVVFLHFLAVRSGLVGFYAVLVFGLVRAVLRFRQRKWFWQSVGAGLLVLLFCFQFPSFQQELKSTRSSIVAYLHGEPIMNPSDRGRIASVEVGIEIGLEHFWTGCGLGDIKNEMQKKYAVNYNYVGPSLLPHNQFVFFFTLSGIVGFVWFGLVWLFLSWWFRSAIF